MNWYLEILKNYAVINGRACRKEYWIFFFIDCIIAFVLNIIGQFIDQKIFRMSPDPNGNNTLACYLSICSPNAENSCRCS